MSNQADTKTDKLRRLARDLRQEPPRSADDRVGEFPKAARVLDKCRAALLGMQGEYKFGCPFDQAFFQEAGVRQEDFKDVVATGATDEEVGDWLRLNARAPVH